MIFHISRKSQTTIFIIVGIMLVSMIILILFFVKKEVPGLGDGKEINPNVFLETCIEDKVKESVKIISSQGGYISNLLHKTFKFENEEDFTNISYLCYTQNYYIPCVNQEPVLINHLKDEIKDYILEDVKNCFDDLASNLEKQKYVVDAIYRGFEIELMPKKISVKIDAELTLTKTGESSKKKDFEVIIPSKFYGIAIVVQEIISQEARFCSFEQLGFMLIYTDFNIDKFRTGDSTIIYTVQHKDSKEKFRFAIRGCVIPPGI